MTPPHIDGRAAALGGRVPPPVLPSTTSRRGPEIGDRTANPGQLILLVEDDRAIRELVRRRLLILGYQLLEAPDGDTALALADQHQGPLHLLLTDVVMPTMNGFALAARVTSLHPETSVLFITGYADRPTPETNGVVERWNRTLKEQAIYGRVFRTLDDVRVAVAAFVERYNQSWRLEKLAYRTPIEAREEYELRQAA